MLARAAVRLDGRTIPYTIRRSLRARWVSLWVRPQSGLVVTLPLQAPAADATAFIRRHRRWVARQLDRLARVGARIPLRWPYGGTLPYRGEEQRIVLAAGRPSGIEGPAGGVLTVRPCHPTIEAASRLLKRWYVAQAQRCCADRASQLARQVGVSYRRLRIRDPRTRWGSCSPTGSLSFSYRLVMAPPAVLDYVVLHELCHRIELNHSPRFWDLVASHRPAYRHDLAWLRTYGPYLGL